MTDTLPEAQATPGPVAGPGPVGKKKRRKPILPDRVRRLGLPYLLLLPALLFELLIHMIPMVVGIFMAFKELTQFYIRNWGQAPWAGLDNFKLAVDFDQPVGEALLHSFWVTCAFCVLAVALCWLIGVAAAIFLQDNFKGRGFLRALFLTPYALPIYAAVITWNFMLQHDNGMVNHVLHDQLHLTDERSFWLIGSNSFISLVVVAVWKTWPFAFLIVMAALQNIPKDLYEAAALDGAGRWRQFLSVTVPMLSPVVFFNLVLETIQSFQVFTPAFAISGGDGGPADSTLFYTLYLYERGFTASHMGYAAAMAWMLLLAIGAVTLILFRTSRSWVFYADEEDR